MLGRSSTKGSSSRSFQMPPPPPPPVHGAGGGRTTGAYTLWSTGGHSSGSPSTNTVSLKRDHKRKFNRSLCGVLLGISIVLVILGILGIIGIAVYLGGKNGRNSNFKVTFIRSYTKNCFYIIMVL